MVKNVRNGENVKDRWKRIKTRKIYRNGQKHIKNDMEKEM